MLSLLLLAPPIYKIKSDFQGIFIVGLYPAVLSGDRIKPFNGPGPKNTDNAEAKDTEQPENSKQKSGADLGKSIPGRDMTINRKEAEQIREVKSDINEESRPLDDMGSGLIAPIESEIMQKENGPLKIAQKKQEDAPVEKKAVESVPDNKSLDSREIETANEKPEIPVDKEHKSPPAMPAVPAEVKAPPEEQPLQEMGSGLIAPIEREIKQKENGPLKIAQKKQEDAPVEKKAVESVPDNKSLDSREMETANEEPEIPVDKEHKSPQIDRLNDLNDQQLIIEQTPGPLLPGNNTEKDAKDEDKEPSGASAMASGIIFTEPQVYGDLKIEIKAGESLPKGLKIIALYKEFSKNRRNEPLTRSEVRHIKKMEPQIINREDNALTAVVETTNEGIYDFMMECVECNGKPIKAIVNFRLYEKSAGETAKTLGTITVADKTLIMKILMPEGILWDDTAYFDGYVEDYESITKYHSQSELAWREYKD